LAAWLQESRHDVVLTFEPGDTATGAQLRDVLLHGEDVLDARTELLLLLADRARHVAEVIGPALARGATVVSDRFSPSTLAYQGIGRGLGVEVVVALNEFATGGLEPDVVVVLDVRDPHVARNSDRVERAGDDFHARVRDAYRELAPKYGWSIVDGTGSIEDVGARVRAVVSRCVR
jgi:dTMP kinase